MRDSGNVVGIDLGTSTTLVATPEQVIPIGRSHKWIPSIAAAGTHGLLVGDDAADLNPDKQLRSPKRYITEELDKRLPPPPDGVDPMEALELLLRGAVHGAGNVGVNMDEVEVRLGCPAMWTGRQREMLCVIAQLVGIDVDISDLVEEPVAVGVSWIIDQRNLGRFDADGRVVVVDAGGGTTDVAVLQAQDGGRGLQFSVLASDAISMAGDHIDDSISEYLRTKYGLDEREVGDAELLSASRLLKETLTIDRRATVRVGLGGRVELTLSRDDFEELFQPTLKKVIGFTEAVVRSAKMRERDHLSPSSIRSMPWESVCEDISTVVVAGGTGQVPAIRRALSEKFGRPVTLLASPQTAVVEGLATNIDYGRINLPRPPFDFVLSYEERSGERVEKILYDAFSPLYEPHAVFLGSPQYRHQVELPASFCGGETLTVECRTPGQSHRPVPLSIVWKSDNGKPAKQTSMAFEIPFNPYGSKQRFTIVLQPDGAVVLGGQKYFIEEWPVVRGRHARAALPPINVRRTSGPARPEWDLSK